MSNLHKPALAGQVVSLEKSAHYWLRRAEQHRKLGEHRRAAALLRHAVALEPASGDLRLEYAEALRDMRCFEASNRAAFDALALEPEGFQPYNLIGRNMLSLGREQEAVDAFSHYLDQARIMPMEALAWDDDVYEIEDLLDAAPHRGASRYDALVHIASLRLAHGNLAGAERALRRAGAQAAADSRLDALYAMLYQALNQPEKALSHALKSAHQNPHHVPTLCALASVHVQMRQRGLAAAAMIAAAPCCRYPHEEQLYCFTAVALNLENLALGMLRYNNRKTEGRLPTLYNLAVILLRAGETQEAMALLHRCRDLDPDDLTVKYVFQLAMEWTGQGLEPSVLQKHAGRLAFYPFLPPAAEQQLLDELAGVLSQGIEAFAEKLRTDPSFQRTFLYALALPTDSFSRLLFPIAAAMSAADPEAAHRFLRSVLVQNTQDGDIKRYALSSLAALGAPPPYVIWQNGRIVQAALQSEAGSTPSFTQRLLARRIKRAARKAGDPGLIAHALLLLRRMSHHQRYAFAMDPAHVWTGALLRHFALTYRLALPSFPPFRSQEQQRRACRAFAILCAHMPLPRKEEL